jgi:hypothetical protein
MLVLSPGLDDVVGMGLAYLLDNAC